MHSKNDKEVRSLEEASEVILEGAKDGIKKAVNNTTFWLGRIAGGVVDVLR